MLHNIIAILMILVLNSSRISTKPSNFVIILTDDQDLLLDGLKPMTRTQQLISNNGVTFSNAIVNSPICCPSRSTLLTGKYPHTLGVRNNSISGNCSSRQFQNWHEPQSIASILKSKLGYRTFYAGKYLNEYGSKEAGGISHVPEGYDWWLGLKGNSVYYNYTLSVNGTARIHANDYLTDVIKSSALDFLNVGTYTSSSSFFMMLATPASHAPFTPAPRHKNRFKNVTCVTTPSFNYTSKDKHWLVEMTPNHLPDNVDILNDIQRGRLQTLLAVDELVDEIITKLKNLGVYEDTYVIFTSDNGFHIGQFTQPWDKRQPYETDIRVPLLMSGPKIPKKVTSDYPVTFVDLAPTILDLAGIVHPEDTIDSDGTSFKRQLFNGERPLSYDKLIFIEYWGEGSPKTVDTTDCSNLKGSSDNLAECKIDSWCKCQDSRNNTYTCAVNSASSGEAFKYCRFAGDFYEAYNLTNDPFELRNVYGEMTESAKSTYADLLNTFKDCKGESCRILQF